jgi:small-conductance mechanosensitive channel
MAHAEDPPVDEPEEIRSRSGTLTSAFVGAVVSVVASFVPVSPILGGGVAAYLRKGDSNESIRVGAISGLMAAAPLVVIVTMVFGFLSIIPLAGGEPMGTVFFWVLLVFGAGMILVYTVALSALGGFVGHEVLDHQQSKRRTRKERRLKDSETRWKADQSRSRGEESGGNRQEAAATDDRNENGSDHQPEE